MKTWIVAIWNHDTQKEESARTFYTALEAWQYVLDNKIKLYVVYEAKCVIDQTLDTEAQK